MEKKRIVTSIDKLTPEIKELIAQQYPLGWKDKVIRITKPNGEYFHAISLDTPEVAYLIKVPVKVDSKADLEKEEERGFSDSDSGEEPEGEVDVADESPEE